MLCFHY
ncbi:hypothetical protein CAJAP_09606 [Camponotus japonicus]